MAIIKLKEAIAVDDLLCVQYFEFDRVSIRGGKTHTDTVHVESDCLSTLPGLWEHCMQGNVMLLLFLGVFYYSIFLLNYLNKTCMQVTP